MQFADIRKPQGHQQDQDSLKYPVGSCAANDVDDHIDQRRHNEDIQHIVQADIEYIAHGLAKGLKERFHRLVLFLLVLIHQIVYLFLPIKAMEL